VLTHFKLEALDLYQFMVLRDEQHKRHQSFYHLVYFTAYTVTIYLLCSCLHRSEVFFVCNILQGYLGYRVWAYIHHRTNERGANPFWCFPFVNFSSAAVLFFFTLIGEGGQICNFVLSLYDETAGLQRLDIISLNDKA